MIFDTSQRLSMQPETLNISFAHQSIQYTTSYKYLGVEVDSTLNMNAYKDQTYKKCSSRLRLLNKLRPLMNSHCAKTIYQSMILPLLTYCGTLQLSYNKTQQERLDAFHRRAMNLCGLNESQRKRVPSPIAYNAIHSLTLVRQCLNGEVCNNF